MYNTLNNDKNISYYFITITNVSHEDTYMH